jgi:phage baseplate assembly protein W
VDNQITKQASHLGSGWAFPVTFSAGNYQLQLSSYADNVNDSIHSILMTRMGERALEPQFGSGLQQFFFRTMDETLKGEIIDAIKVSLLRNEPRITVISVSADFIDLLTGRAEVTVIYIYNQANTRHNYVFPLHLKEGTNLSQ